MQLLGCGSLHAWTVVVLLPTTNNNSYVAVGRSERAVNAVRHLLEDTGAIASTTLVAASAHATAAAQYLAPFTGAAIARAARDNGGAALIVYDDLGAHNEAGRRCVQLCCGVSSRCSLCGRTLSAHRCFVLVLLACVT